MSVWGYFENPRVVIEVEGSKEVLPKICGGVRDIVQKMLSWTLEWVSGAAWWACRPGGDPNGRVVVSQHSGRAGDIA